VRKRSPDSGQSSKSCRPLEESPCFWTTKRWESKFACLAMSHEVRSWLFQRSVKLLRCWDFVQWIDGVQLCSHAAVHDAEILSCRIALLELKRSFTIVVCMPCLYRRPRKSDFGLPLCLLAIKHALGKQQCFNDIAVISRIRYRPKNGGTLQFTNRILNLGLGGTASLLKSYLIVPQRHRPMIGQ